MKPVCIMQMSMEEDIPRALGSRLIRNFNQELIIWRQTINSGQEAGREQKESHSSWRAVMGVGEGTWGGWQTAAVPPCAVGHRPGSEASLTSLDLQFMKTWRVIAQGKSRGKGTSWGVSALGLTREGGIGRRGWGWREVEALRDILLGGADSPSWWIEGGGQGNRGTPEYS